MKKRFAFVSLLLCCGLQVSYAQYDKTNKYWTLQAFAEGTNTYVKPSAAINASPYSLANNRLGFTYRRGKFTKKNIAQGWFASYEIDAYMGDYANDFFGHDLYAGYFVEQYKTISPKVALYGQLAASIGYHFTSEYFPQATKDYWLALNAHVGMRYYIKKNIFLNAQTSLANLTFDVRNDKQNQTTTYLQLSSVMQVGMLAIGIGKSF